MTESILENRHTLVWVKAEKCETLAKQVSDIETQDQIAEWLAADRPLVVARQPCKSIPSDTIAVGLALTPAQGKRRIALVLNKSDIARNSLPLQLRNAIASAPVEWQNSLVELDTAASDLDIELRVFGSLAWQALSGLQYMNRQSDIDLLWHPLSNNHLQQGIALLQRWEQGSGLRADGEVLFGGSSAVSWREWAALKTGEAQRVLVKRTCSADLVEAGELLEILA